MGLDKVALSIYGSPIWTGTPRMLRGDWFHLFSPFQNTELDITFYIDENITIKSTIAWQLQYFFDDNEVTDMLDAVWDMEVAGDVDGAQWKRNHVTEVDPGLSMEIRVAELPLPYRGYYRFKPIRNHPDDTAVGNVKIMTYGVFAEEGQYHEQSILL